jgi:hypothetical protein
MTQKIGPREAALRAQREQAAKPAKLADVKLPMTSGKKPVKRKRRKG